MPILLTLWSLIKRAEPLHIALVCALAFAALQTVRIEGLKVWPLVIHGLKEQRDSARDELGKVTTPRNEQKARTIETIKQADEGRKQAEPIARRIETAPIEPGCKTPAAILGADL